MGHLVKRFAEIQELKCQVVFNQVFHHNVFQQLASKGLGPSLGS